MDEPGNVKPNRLGGTTRTYAHPDVQPRRRTPAIIILLGLVAAGLASCSSTSSTPTTTLPPRPALSNFVPSSAVVTSQRTAQLTPTGPPQEVVTYISQQSSSVGFTNRDLLILSWDQYASRWVDVFDASKVRAPGQSGADSTVLPCQANVVRLEDFPLTSAPGRTDLVLWLYLNFGANGNLEVAVVHFDGQTASVAYLESYPPAHQGNPTVVGVAPRQQISIPAGWLTSVDPECCAVRDFTDTVGFHTQVLSGGYHSSTYFVTGSTQSWLGVYAVEPLNPNGATPPPNPIVVTVVPGSPAAGVLRPGDQLLSVSGANVSATGLLGPAVIDEVAKNLPGAAVPLSILRNGNQLVVNVTLASRAAPSYSSTTAPSVGYLGVQVSTQAAQGSSPAGVLIQGVESGSAAGTAGLVTGDEITSIGSASVSSVDSLSTVLYLTPPGTSVQIAYVGTDGVPAMAAVTMGSWPTSGAAPSVVAI
jgi:hypothetical protein